MDLVLRVRGQADASLVAIFRPWVAASAAAQRSVEANLNSSAKTAVKGAQEAAAAHKLAGQVQAETIRSVQAQRNAEHRQFMADLREEEREAKKAAKAIADERKKQAREAAKEEEKNQRIGSAAMRTFGGYLRTGIGYARNLLGAAGVDLDPASLLKKAITNQALAVRVADYGYIEGEKGAAGVRQDPEAIKREARSAAKSAALLGGTNEALEGLAEFTKKSSELELGRNILERMAKFAKATGSDFKEVASSAGDIAKKLGDVPNKAEAVMGALSILNREGKFGAIDFSDLAKVIPTVIGGANKFQQGSAAAVSQLGVALQIAKSFGGAKGPAQAATSVANFVNYLTSAAGQKNLLAGGLKDTDIFADKDHKQLRSVEDIVVRSLEETGGDLTKMSKMFRNQRAGAVLQGFGQVFSEAEAQKKGSGAAAVREVFRSYGAQTSQLDLDESLKRKLSTDEARTARFNARMEEIGEKFQAGLAPALDKLAPRAEQAAEALAGIVEFGAEHPVAAITAALVASIAKARVSEAIGGGLSKLLGSAGGSLAIGTAALVIGVATIAAEKWDKEKQDAAEGEKMKTEQTENLLKKAEGQFAKTGKVDPELMAELIRRRTDIAAQEKAANLYEGPDQSATGKIKRGLVKVGAYITGDTASIAGTEGAMEQNFAQQGQVASQAKGIDALVSQLKGTLRVHVENAADIRSTTSPTGPGIDASARTSGVR